MRGEDVGVGEACNRANFPEKAIGSDSGSELWPQDLQCEMSRMTRLFCEIHSSHAAASQNPFQLIAIVQGSTKSLHLVFNLGHRPPGSST